MLERRPASSSERLRVQLHQFPLQRPASTMVEAMDRTFAAVHLHRYFAGCESDDVAQQHHRALILGQSVKGSSDAVRPIQVRGGDLARIEQFAWGRSVSPHMVDCDVARKPQKPREERDAAVVVLDNRRHQFCENLLCQVLSLIFVSNNRADVSVDVVRIHHVEASHGIEIALLGTRNGFRDTCPCARRFVERGPYTEAHCFRRFRPAVNSHKYSPDMQVCEGAPSDRPTDHNFLTPQRRQAPSGISYPDHEHTVLSVRESIVGADRQGSMSDPTHAAFTGMNARQLAATRVSARPSCVVGETVVSKYREDLCAIPDDSQPLSNEVPLTAIITIDATSPDSATNWSGARVLALEHVANRSILHHALDGLVEAGIDDVILVGEADALIEVRGEVESYHRRLRGVRYAVRREGVDFGSTLRAVGPLIGDSACVIQPGDGLFGLPMQGPLESLLERESDLVIFAASEGNASETTGSPYGGDSHHGRMAGNPWTIDRDTESTTELGVFGPGALRRALAVIGDRRRVDADDDQWRLHGLDAGASVPQFDSWLRYRGDRRNLLELNRLALDRLERDAPAQFADGNKLEGRVAIDPSASIRDSVIIGPTIIGPGAIVGDAYIGAYTSIGAGARVEGAEIERSIVAARASVTHVGGRLVGSLVGRDARVSRDFSLPRAIRLWVGDGNEVSLC
jgi:glucose-1-phosphate thymidylyltransferase